MSILNIIEEIAATSSRLTKESILKREFSNETLKHVISAAYNPYINYWIKKIPEYTRSAHHSSLDAGIDALSMIANRTYTGRLGIDYLESVLSDLEQDDAIVMERIIERDLRAGISASTVNKIWAGLIPTFDVMLSHKDISGIKYPAIAQTKMDGARCHLYFDGVIATAFSRSGKPFNLHGVLDETAKKLMFKDETWDGELLFYKDGHALDRKTSNGLAAKANKGTLSKEECLNVRFIPWDIVDSPLWSSL